MSTYHHILFQFKKLNLQDNSKLTEFEINNAVDTLASQNSHLIQFNRDISIQIWQHATKTPEGKVLLKDYIQTLTDAIELLKENIHKCQEQLRVQYNKNRQQIEECLLSYQQDLKVINQAFNLKQNSYNHKPAIGSPDFVNNLDVFPEKQAQKSQQSPTLKYVFMIVLIMILLELFCMFVRHHFINIVTNLSVLSIFVLQYFDRTYIKFVLTTVATATVSDGIWLFVHSQNYWNLPLETHYSHLQNTILRLIYLITVVLLIVKVVIFLMIFGFSQNFAQKLIHVNVFGIIIELRGDNATNVVSNLLIQQKNQT